MICEFVVYLYTSKYMEFYKVWQLYFGMWKCTIYFDWLFMTLTLKVTKDSTKGEEHYGLTKQFASIGVTNLFVVLYTPYPSHVSSELSKLNQMI